MDLDFDNKEFITAVQLIQEKNESFFLTGKAGTGKSTFLKHIVETTGKNFIVVAPTGIAAVNVGGATIHSFFHFPLRPLLPEDEDIKVFWKNSEKRSIISAMDTLIIDEISMVRADLIDGIDYSLRRNGGNPNLPFGGKQVVFVGDIFQLEPVMIKRSGEQKIINEIYGSPYFYNAKVFEKVNLRTIELQKVYRQSDPSFISLLDKVRVKETSQFDIDKINTRVFSESELREKEFAITLTTRNDLADGVNSKKLKELNSTPFVYVAEVSGIFEENKYPTDPELILKEGAQVILIKNDSENRWVNGTIGQVSELTETSIKVKFEDGNVHIIEARVWENMNYHHDREKKKILQEIIGTFKQFPIKLAWAITIHKSQGLTFDNVIIDFGTGTFASGQAYVALSRVKSFNGLFLKHKIHNTDIYIDEEIKDFAKSFTDKNIIENNKNKFQYEKNDNLEATGELQFNSAIINLKNGNFKSAFDELMLGFENISCDCSLRRLIIKDKELINTSFCNSPINCSLKELDFIRAMFYFFSDTEYKALPFINSFLETNENSEVGHYLKGRILLRLNNLIEGVKELEAALNIRKTARVYYRLGRLSEEALEKFGWNNLLQSIFLNPYSFCVHTWLFASAYKRNLKLKTNPHVFLVSEFNNQLNPLLFATTINQLLENSSIELEDKSKISATVAFSDFLITLKADEHLFDFIPENNKDDDPLRTWYPD